MERPLPLIPGTEEFEDNHDDNEDDIKEDYYSIISQQQAISLQLDPLENDNGSNGAYLTPLRELVTAHKLPITVRAGCTSEDTIIAEGDLMVLHFITWRQRILAKYDDGTEVVLPVHASQLYDVLPEESVHDDMVFHTTRDVINSKPLPGRVRVINLDNFESKYSNFGQEGDIIDISHVGQVDVYGIAKRKILVGTCNGSQINIDEDVKCAYTTMVEPESHSLYQILAKNSLPLRVRQSHDRVGLVLTASREEAHVIATHVASRRVLSIPVDGPISLRYEDDESTLSDAISPLYPLVNWTLCDWEYGRTVLSKYLQEIPQPLEQVSRQWIHSDDGKNTMRKILQEDCQCGEKKGQLAAKEQDDVFESKEHGLIKKTSSIRDKLKQLKSKRRSSEPSAPYDYVERPAELGGQTRAQLEEMKSILKAKGVETVKLREENETLRMEKQKLQQRISQLSISNKQYLDRLNKMYIEYDGVKGSQSIKSKLAPSNNYVGITSANNAINSSTTSSSTNQPHLPKEDASPSISVHRKTLLQSASVEEVGQFLRDLKLDSYVEIFREELVNGNLLLELDFDTLVEDLNMSRIHAKRLNLAIRDKVGKA